jgi:hypothetical protein
MGTWTTKFRKPALIAGMLAIVVMNPAFSRDEQGSKRAGAGFAGGAKYFFPGVAGCTIRSRCEPTHNHRAIGVRAPHSGIE